jgi:hypothetical protein
MDGEKAGLANPHQQQGGNLIKLAQDASVSASSEKSNEKAHQLLKKINKRELKARQARHGEEEKKLLQLRKLSVPFLERIFPDKDPGYFISVSGENNTTLKIKHIFMSWPLVNKLNRNRNLFDIWQALGFNKVIFTDGYHTSWIYFLGKEDLLNSM